ncbi:hypothetical protein BGW37DRAFT_507739 [Umbelopsis sp. PMI_123]|nr:hypothetical protein BGW37DRAFT_507739 [Umbelopsis sp. PMI_123]
MNCSTAQLPSINGAILVSTSTSVLLIQYISYGMYQAALPWIQRMCNQKGDHLQFYTFQTSYPGFVVGEFKRIINEINSNDSWYINLGRFVAWIFFNTYLVVSIFLTTILTATASSVSIKNIVVANSTDMSNTTIVEIMWHRPSGECITYAPYLYHQTTSGILLNRYMLIVLSVFATIMIIYTFFCNYMHGHYTWIPPPLHNLLFISPLTGTEYDQSLFALPGQLFCKERDGESYVMIGDKLLVTLSKNLDWNKVNAILDGQMILSEQG